MKSIKLPGFDLEIGKGQEDTYNVLHAMNMKNQEGEVLMCFELTDEEIAEITKTKKIYYTRLTFGQSFQPMRLHTELGDNIVLIDENGKPVEEIKWITCPNCEGRNHPGNTLCDECEAELE